MIILHCLSLTLTNFQQYLLGGPTTTLLEYMRNYDKRLDDLDHDFTQPLPTDANTRDAIEEILKNLGIPQAQWAFYFTAEETLYSFLLKLSRAGFVQATYLVETVDDKYLLTKILFGFGAFYGALGLAAVLSHPYFAEYLHSIIEFFGSELGFPVSGIIQATATMVCGLYTTSTDYKQSWKSRLRDGAFVLAKAAVNLVGYALWIAETIPPTWALGGMFVLSSLLDVAREICCLIQEHFNYHNGPSINSEDPLVVRRAQIRHEYSSQQHCKAALISFVNVLVIVGLTAVGTFIPGLGIAIAVGIGLALTNVITHFLQRRNERVIRDGMQAALARVGQPEEIELTEAGKPAQHDNSAGKVSAPQLPIGRVTSPTTNLKRVSSAERMRFFPQVQSVEFEKETFALAP